ncbi:GGDEF domain-containing protein [Methylobacterium sp.]|jgi:diguanylate cyclase (GGDEF)-like protein|uniref:GGDEF domain-containing protein n=1 Tax=Methylobacterium sp. TaxID=409 RepID=UPI0026241D74|nr:GGDEF domain-containing protein [Methylobacterium sp.]MDB5646406.1 hypothetical protein [Methylobacterium sp.]
MDAAAAQRTADAATIHALRAELALRNDLIQSQAAALAWDRAIFEQASTAARIGLWECDLASESLRWSDGVCDLFEFPRGTRPDRSETLNCYPEEARRRLVAVRTEAIAKRSGFTLDTEIVGRLGSPRWIRITATVECRGEVPMRLFGLKQDITFEKLQSDRARHRAEFDYLTGLANRALFESRLAAIPQAGTLLLVDLDGFKQVNDTHGHAAGDACLREAARRLGEACHDADLVARIGGDEFAVLLATDPDGSLGTALGHRIVEAMRAPFVYGTASLSFGASVGVACASHCAPGDLFHLADNALYAAKAAGRGTAKMAAPDLSRSRHGENSVGR